MSDHSRMSRDEVLRVKLEILVREHRDLDDAIGALDSEGRADVLTVRRLKKRKLHLKDEMMPRYAELVYNGFWFSPERQMLQALIDESQKRVNGTARLKLYRGGVMVAGRKSPAATGTSKRYSESVASAGSCSRSSQPPIFGCSNITRRASESIFSKV